MDLSRSEIFVRADGSPQIGLGHVVRCMALSLMLKNEFEITFYYREMPDSMVKEISDGGFGVVKIEHEEQFFEKLYKKVVVVLDGYGFDDGYQHKIKIKGAKLVCIDDLHNNLFLADLIINHAPGITPQAYKTKPYTQFALGLDFALLRPAFLEQAKNQREIVKIETVLVCFGGSDSRNLTERTLQVVLRFQQFIKIYVVTGSAFVPGDELGRLLDSDPRIEHRQALTEQKMLETMLDSDLAIVPSSGILFEALASGCLVVSGNYVDNQKLVYENFRDSGCFTDAGNFEIPELTKAINEVINGHTKNPVFIDGNSATRVIRLFDQLNKETFITVRKAKVTDLDITFGWASSAEIRRYAFQQHQISKSEHTNWFLNKLAEANCRFYIIEYKNEPIGSIRFDIREGEAKISYLLDPLFHGQGFGQLILKKGIEQLLNEVEPDHLTIHLVSGDVMTTNVPSIKAFERLGFIRKMVSENFKFEKLVI
ncbi:MAG: UDP-2,4-diacetamido-2,4,6-trideoxy-beta-L-altropyranose hydrolase [Bacteroidota bacterium]